MNFVDPLLLEGRDSMSNHRRLLSVWMGIVKQPSPAACDHAVTKWIAKKEIEW